MSGRGDAPPKRLDDVLEDLTQQQSQEQPTQQLPAPPPQQQHADYVAKQVFPPLFPSDQTHHVHHVQPLVQPSAPAPQQSSTNVIQPSTTHAPAQLSQNQLNLNQRQKLAQPPISQIRSNPIQPQRQHAPPHAPIMEPLTQPMEQETPANPPVQAAPPTPDTGIADARPPAKVNQVALQPQSELLADAAPEAQPKPLLDAATETQSKPQPGADSEAQQPPTEALPKAAHQPQPRAQAQASSLPAPQIAISQVTASQPATQPGEQQLMHFESDTGNVASATQDLGSAPSNIEHEEDRLLNDDDHVPIKMASKRKPRRKLIEEINEDELMDEEDRLLEEAQNRGEQNSEEQAVQPQAVKYPLSFKASLMHSDIAFYKGKTENEAEDVKFVAFTPSPKRRKQTDSIKRKPRRKYEKSKKLRKYKSDFSSSSEDEYVEVKEKKKKLKVRKSRRNKREPDSDLDDNDWNPQNAEKSDGSDDDSDSDLEADDYEEMSDIASNSRKRKSTRRKRLRRNLERTESEDDVPRKRKRTRRAIAYHTDDDDDDRFVRVIQRKKSRKRTRGMKAPSRNLTKQFGYKKDGWIVSSADGSDPDDDDDGNGSPEDDDDASEESEQETDPLWKKRMDDIKRVLDGNKAPFKKPIICVICRAAGNRPIGDPTNGWRDGFIQPHHNFSANVQKGKYGVRMTAEFCLQHTAGDQNRYIEQLQDAAEKIPDYMGPDDEEDNRSSESEPDARSREHSTPSRYTKKENEDDEELDDVEQERPNVLPLRKYRETPRGGRDDSESDRDDIIDVDDDMHNNRYASDYTTPVGTGSKRRRKQTGSDYERDGWLVSADDDTTPRAGTSSDVTPSSRIRKKVAATIGSAADPLWVARRKQVEKELDGEHCPFPRPIICMICKLAKAPPIGSKKKQFRNGYIQPDTNFTLEVRRGNYGRYMRKPFCSLHNTRDQQHFAPQVNQMLAEIKKKRQPTPPPPPRPPSPHRNYQSDADLPAPPDNASPPVPDDDGDTVDLTKDAQIENKAQDQTPSFNSACVCPHCTHCQTARAAAGN